MLGKADMVWADVSKTKIIGGHGNPEKIDERANIIKEKIKSSDSEFEKKQLKERLAKLVSGAAIVKVGGFTEVEMKDRKERVIDAVEATKSAVEEGIVAGGGITLYNISERLSKTFKDKHDEDVVIGYEVVRESLKMAIEKLLHNAGVNKEEVIKNLKKGWSKNAAYGYNVVTKEYGDMFEMGIIDPTKVTKNAVQNGASVAGQILTTEAIVVELPEETIKHHESQ
jgi:chaperonin GroEL